MLTGCESCGAYLSVEGRTHCGGCAQDEINALREALTDANARAQNWQQKAEKMAARNVKRMGTKEQTRRDAALGAVVRAAVGPCDPPGLDVCAEHCERRGENFAASVFRAIATARRNEVKP